MIPKFRAFVKAGTKPVYGSWDDTDQMFYEIRDIDYYDKTVTVWGCHNKDCGMCDDTYKMEDVEVMMSTGLKEKNGIEIYEGDVIKDKYDKVWLVQRYVGAFVITNKIPDSDGQTSTHSHFSNVSNHHFYFEVIGNMWDNPELLEVVE